MAIPVFKDLRIVDSWVQKENTEWVLLSQGDELGTIIYDYPMYQGNGIARVHLFTNFHGITKYFVLDLKGTDRKENMFKNLDFNYLDYITEWEQLFDITLKEIFK